LINKLIPTVTQRVKAVSGKLGRGRHTTRHVELFELPAGGLLADTPGFNQPDLICTPENLGKCFPEIRDRLLAVSCQFTDCLHQGEPGCGISTNWERYTTYLELLQICIDQTQTLMNSANPEAAYKIKITESGQVQHEPRLAPKKYRQVSRRRHHQSLQELRYELSHKVEDLEALESEELDG
jgi:ribosome biogenesis GTPase